MLAGSYPAFLLSSLKPALALKGDRQPGLTGTGLRKTLVIFQFTLSMVLICCSIVMKEQINYLLKKDLGYDRHQVINIWIDDVEGLSWQSVKEDLRNHSAVQSVASGVASPMEINGYAEVLWPGKSSAEPVLLYGATADHDLLPLLKVDFVAGRNFSRDLASDSSNFIITESAAAIMGLSNPIGERITYTMDGKKEGEIIGVIRDFNNDDIHLAMNPVIFSFDTDPRNLFVRYNDLDPALAHMKKVFEKLQPGIPVSYSFLDEDFENQFYRERLLGNFSLWSTSIAILIACLGLLGLTMFNTQRRRKEMGIRKVLGASAAEVLSLLCREFMKPVVIAIVLAFPVAFWMMEKFLQGYVYRTHFPVWVFPVVASAMIVIVLATVLYHSLRASRENPVETLRTE